MIGPILGPIKLSKVLSFELQFFFEKISKYSLTVTIILKKTTLLAQFFADQTNINYFMNCRTQISNPKPHLKIGIFHQVCPEIDQELFIEIVRACLPLAEQDLKIRWEIICLLLQIRTKTLQFFFRSLIIQHFKRKLLSKLI